MKTLHRFAGLVRSKTTATLPRGSGNTWTGVDSCRPCARCSAGATWRAADESDHLQLADGERQPHALRSATRIQDAAHAMEALIEALLILAHEGDLGTRGGDFVLNVVMREQVEAVRPLLAGKPVGLSLHAGHAIALHAPRRMLSVLPGNLLRNACRCTDAGQVMVRVSAGDSGTGHDARGLAQARSGGFCRRGAQLSRRLGTMLQGSAGGGRDGIRPRGPNLPA